MRWLVPWLVGWWLVGDLQIVAPQFAARTRWRKKFPRPHILQPSETTDSQPLPTPDRHRQASVDVDLPPTASSSFLRPFVLVVVQLANQPVVDKDATGQSCL